VLLPSIAIVSVFWYRGTKAARAAAEDSRYALQGAQAGAQSHVVGREAAAVVAAVEALSSAIATGRQIPSAAVVGAAEAAGRMSRIELPARRGEVWSLACSPDGTRIATTGDDGLILSSDRGDEVASLSKTATFATDFTPDGAALATGLGNVVVRPIEGTARDLGAIDGVISAIAVSPDGRTIIVGDNQGTVYQFSETGSPPSKIGAFGDMVTDVALSLDGAFMAASSADGTARVWSVGETEPAFEIPPERDPVGEEITISRIAFHPDGKRLMTVGPITAIWELATKQQITVLPRRQTQFVRFGEFSRDGGELILGGLDGLVTRWDARTYGFLETAIRNPAELKAMSYCGAERRVALAGKDGRVALWDLSRDNSSVLLRGGSGPAIAASFAADGKSVFVGRASRGGASGRVERWDLATRKPLGSAIELEWHVWALSLSADGQRLHALTRQGELVSWDTDLAAEISRVSLGQIGRGFFSGDGTRVAAADAEGIRVWSVATGQMIGRVPIASNVMGAGGFAADGTSVVVLVERETTWTAEIWDLNAAAPRIQLGHESEPLVSAAFSPRGDQVVTTGAFGTVAVWDIARRQVVAQLVGHVGTVWSAVFSPEGTTIATLGDDNTIRLWDAMTGAALAVFTGHGQRVFAASFSPDGEGLATAGFDGTVRIYPVQPSGTLALACDRIRGLANWSRVEALCPASTNTP
jgi:WD40 repeat protein